MPQGRLMPDCRDRQIYVEKCPTDALGGGGGGEGGHCWTSLMHNASVLKVHVNVTSIWCSKDGKPGSL